MRMANQSYSSVEWSTSQDLARILQQDQYLRARRKTLAIRNHLEAQDHSSNQKAATNQKSASLYLPTSLSTIQSLESGPSLRLHERKIPLNLLRLLLLP